MDTVGETFKVQVTQVYHQTRIFETICLTDYSTLIVPKWMRNCGGIHLGVILPTTGIADQPMEKENTEGNAI